MAIQWASACESAYSKSDLQRNSEGNAATSIEVSGQSAAYARLPCMQHCLCAPQPQAPLLVRRSSLLALSLVPT
jgi:hypothetical protein